MTNDSLIDIAIKRWRAMAYPAPGVGMRFTPEQCVRDAMQALAISIAEEVDGCHNPSAVTVAEACGFEWPIE